MSTKTDEEQWERRRKEGDRSIDQVERAIKNDQQERSEEACHVLNRIVELTADHLPDNEFKAVVLAVKHLVTYADIAALNKASDELVGF